MPRPYESPVVEDLFSDRLRLRREAFALCEATALRFGDEGYRYMDERARRWVDAHVERLLRVCGYEAMDTASKEALLTRLEERALRRWAKRHEGRREWWNWTVAQRREAVERRWRRAKWIGRSRGAMMEDMARQARLRKRAWELWLLS